MNDQLFYDIVLQLDNASVSDVQKQIDNLSKSFDDAFKKSSGATKAVNELGELVDITEKSTESNNKHISSLVDAQKALEEKRKELTKLNKEIKDDVTVTDEQAQSKLRLTEEIKGLSQQINGIQKDTLALNAGNLSTARTYDELVKQNKALMVQMRSVPIDDTTGKLAKLQAQYNSNNMALKKFDAELGNHQRNVGNYSSALQSAAQQLAVIQGPLGPIAGRLSSLSTIIRGTTTAINTQTTAWGKLKVAMAATGLGAVIIVIGFIITQLMKLQPVMDRMNQAWAAFGAAVGVVRDNLGALLGLNEKNALTMREAARAASELRKQAQALRDTEIEAIGVKAKLELQIAQLRDATRDENITNERRLELIDEAIEKEGQLLDIELYLARERARIAAAELAINESDAEAIREVAEAEAELARVEMASLNARRRMRTERLSLINSIRAEEKRANEQALKDRLELDKRIVDAEKALRDSIKIDTKDIIGPSEFDITELLKVDDIERANQFLIDSFQQQERQRTDMQINMLRERGQLVQALEIEQEREFQDFRIQAIVNGLTSEEEIRAAFRQREIDFEQDKNRAIEQMNQIRMDASISMAKNAITAIEGMNRSFFGNSKMLNVSLATMDAIAAAVSAARSTPGGPIAKGLASSAQLFQGMARVRQIQRVTLGGSASVASVSSGSGQSQSDTGEVFRLRDVSEQATNPVFNMAPAQNTFVFEGDLNNEILSIKVRQGNDIISSNSVGVI